MNGQASVNIAVVVFSAITLGWFLFRYYRKPRSLWLGVSFMAAMLGLLALSILLLVQFSSNQLVNVVLVLGIAAAVFGLMLLPFAVVFSLITSGSRLIRREGFSLSNSLSLGLGIFYILYLLFWPMLRGKVSSELLDFLYAYLSFCFVLTSGIFVVYTVTSFLNLIPRRRKPYKHIIVLGCGLGRDGMTVTPLLAGRVDKGIQVYRNNPGSLLIMSGGQGADEKIAEGQAMKDHALAQGVPEEDILVEDRSTSTRENLMFSRQLLDQSGRGEGPVLVVTTKYHVLRALLLAKELDMPSEGRGSKTKLYFSINAFVREWIAYLVLCKKSYIVLLLAGLAVIAAAYMYQP